MPELADMAIAVAFGFTFGAIPIAYFVGRLNGVNVFEVGSRQAGATNVLKAVNRRAGLVVFALDAGKGVATIYVSHTVLNIDLSWLWAPSAATVAGHWMSPVTRFRGGDGVACLFGATAGTFGVAFLVPTLIIGVAMYLARFYHAHPSFWGGLAGVASLGAALAYTDGGYTREELTAYGGVLLLSLIVFVKSYAHHRRHGPFTYGDLEPAAAVAEPLEQPTE